MVGSQATLLQRWGRQFGVEVDDNVIGRLAAYVSLLGVWNQRIRLTGERDSDVIIEKHLPDCLAVAGFVQAGMRVGDVGSGAGLPGVVLAAAVPGALMKLVEPRRRPASFLREVARTLPLPGIEVVEDRWESWAESHPQSLELVTGRAIKLDVVLGQAVRVLVPGGRVVGMQSQHPEKGELGGLAAQHGLRLVETRSYVVPSGEPRQLAIFERA